MRISLVKKLYLQTVFVQHIYLLITVMKQNNKILDKSTC